MIYMNSKPVARRAHAHTPNRHFEWRGFMEDGQDTADLIRERFEYEGKEKRVDNFFLLPGRKNQITKLNNDETLEVKTLVETPGPLELWETTAKTKLPMRRTLAKRLGARMPKFAGPLVASMSPEELTEGLQKKSRFHRVKNKRETFKRGNVTARIARIRTEDKESVSIAFSSPDADPLMAELRALGLAKRENVNFGEFLTAK